MRRFEIRIHAIAANMDSTTNPSPNALARVAPDASVLESAINAAPTLDATNATQPVGRNRSPEKIAAATASSMGNEPTMSDACETVVSASPSNCTRYWMGTPTTAAAITHSHSPRSKRGLKKKMHGTSAAHANRNRNNTMSATGISLKATLPNKKPVPHRHPAVASAIVGSTRCVSRPGGVIIHWRLSPCDDFLKIPHDVENRRPAPTSP